LGKNYYVRAVMQPKLYTIRPEGFNEVRNKILTKLIPLFILAISVGTYTSFSNLNFQDGDYTSLYIAIPVFLIYGLFSISRSLNRRKKMFESYSLSIDENSIWRDIKDTPSIHLYRSEVEQIQVLPNKVILIKTREKGNMIYVPAQVSNYDDLVNVLSEIKPLEQSDSILKKQRWSILASIAMLGFLVLTFTSSNKFIVTFSGVGLLILSILLLRKVKGNNNIDYKTKRGLNWYWFLMAVIILRVVFIWIGFIK
jgi:hypothetical protein